MGDHKGAPLRSIVFLAKGNSSMIFNVAQLMKSLVGASLTAELGEGHVQLDEDLKIIDPITGRVRMRRVDQGLLVDGWVDLVLEQTCNRCLKQFELPMHVPFEERFYPTLDVVTGVSLPPIEEDEVFPINEHHEVNLTEAIRQNVLLAIPMVTLCNPDCAGLCSQCGHDLNLGPCQCEPETDARLSILKTLLQNQS
jgi:uncharacterized protein